MQEMKAIVSAIVGREVRYTIEKVSRVGERRPFYKIYLGKQSELVSLCEAVQPHVVGKREHVALMLRFLTTTPAVTNTRHGGDGGTGITDEHREIIAQLRALNKRYAVGEWQLLQQETKLTAPTASAEGEVIVRTP